MCSSGVGNVISAVTNPFKNAFNTTLDFQNDQLKKLNPKKLMSKPSYPKPPAPTQAAKSPSSDLFRANNQRKSGPGSTLLSGGAPSTGSLGTSTLLGQ